MSTGIRDSSTTGYVYLGLAIFFYVLGLWIEERGRAQARIIDRLASDLLSRGEVFHRSKRANLYGNRLCHPGAIIGCSLCQGQRIGIVSRVSRRAEAWLLKKRGPRA